jgi:putative transposase
LLEIFGVEVSPALVSQVTDAVVADVQAWQNRPLEEVCPIVYFDALWGKVRENGQVAKVAVYLALGITLTGHKEVLGMWTANTEGAKFWMHVMTGLKNRGVKDMFIGCVDGLKGFPEAMGVVFPLTQVQLCLVHMVRHSLSHVGWKERKAAAQDLKAIYRAATETEVEQALSAFEEKRGRKFPAIGKSWRAHWPELVTFMKYPAEIRKVIYTTNAIESVNRSLRKITKNRGVFPNTGALLKLYWLALERAAKKWTMPIHDWHAARNRFSLELGDRVPPPE